MFRCNSKAIGFEKVAVYSHLEALFFVLWRGSLFCVKIFCGSPRLMQEKSEGEEKNVGGRIKG